MKLRITLVAMLSYFVLHAQTTLNIHLTDLYKKPITFAVVKYQDSTFTSNSSGFFRIRDYTLGSKIIIHKLGFADTAVTVTSLPVNQQSIDLVVVLRLRPMILPEVSVNSSSIEEINPLKADFLLSYELKEEYIFELLSADHFIVTNAENKVIYRSRPIPGAKEMVKDAYGTIYVITDKSAFKVYCNSSGISVDTTSVDLVKLKWNIQYCDEVADTSLFIRRYKDHNQTIGFFAVSNLHLKHVCQLKEISDVDRKNAVTAFANETSSFNEYVASLGLSMMTASSPEEVKLVRTAKQMADRLEMNYSVPYYSLLKLVNDSLYLFAHDIDSMFIYDKTWNLVKSKPINYHHFKIWGKELFVNEERTKVYTKLIDKSKKIMIAEIDLQTGLLKPGVTTISARFPSKVKIKNSTVYFMAKQKRGTGYSVYAQNLNLPK